MDMNRKHIGVDVGGTTINIAIVTPQGEILAKESLKTTTYLHDNEKMILAIVSEIKSLLAKNNVEKDEIWSIGMGFPGTVDSQKGIVVFAPNIYFENDNVKGIMQNAFDCPIYLGQDSRAAAWGEFLIGQKKKVNDMASITIGTGIGCGLIINGMLYHGAYNTAGEFGHQLMDVDGPQCNCGRKGCLETYCGGLSIVRAGKQIMEGLSVKDIYALADVGNKKALDITRQVVEKLGTGIVNLVNLLSLELITISGGISNAPDNLLLNPLHQFVREHAYSAIADKVKIERSVLGDDAPLIGAALQDETTEY